MRRGLAGLCLLLLIVGCTPVMSTDVTRFSALPPVPTAQSFVILPQSDQAGSLEFQHDAELVAGALVARGFRPAAEEKSADLIVRLRYGFAGTRSETTVYDDPSYDYRGPGFGYGWGNETVTTYAVYAVALEVELLDGPLWRKGQRRGVFEGRVIGESSIRDVNAAMPYLVQALFTDFPGASGRTVRVLVPLRG